MITKELFWNQIGEFNSTFQTLHYIWIVLSLFLILYIFIKPGRIINIIFKVFLSMTFLLNGIVFFEFYTKNPVSNYFYGPLFILIGILFIIDIFRNKIIFKLPQQKWLRYATFFWLVLVYVYPLFGILLGRYFPFICMPMNPCPSTVMAVTMVVAAIPIIDRITLISLLPWGLLGLPKAMGAYDCYEDAILFMSGVYGLIMLIVNWRNISRKKK
jgi:hypothetical protein